MSVNGCAGVPGKLTFVDGWYMGLCSTWCRSTANDRQVQRKKEVSMNALQSSGAWVVGCSRASVTCMNTWFCGGLNSIH